MSCYLSLDLMMPSIYLPREQRLDQGILGVRGENVEGRKDGKF